MTADQFRLRVLGGLSLDRNGPRPMPVAVPKNSLSLLALLAAAGPHGMSRDQVQAIRWPESDVERARNALDQALFVVRRRLGSNSVLQGSTALSLNAVFITSDLGEFEAARSAGDCEHANSLYGGPFLHGFHLHDAPEFERWVDGERDRVQRGYGDVLQRLAAAAEHGGKWSEAADWWRRLGALDPLSAAIAVKLMKALAAAGDGASALQHAKVYATLVREELGAAPDPEVLRLTDQIRAAAKAAQSELRSTAAAGTTERVADSAVAGAASSDRLSLPPRRHRGAGLMRLAALTVAILVGLFGALLVRRMPGALDPNGVVVTTNATFARAEGPDPLDAQLREQLIDGVVQTHLATVFPVPSVAWGPARNGRTRLTTQQTHSLARAARVRYVVDAIYQVDGDSLLVGAEITDAEREAVIGPIVPVRSARSASQAAIDSVSSRVMTALAVRLDPKLESWSYAAAMPVTYKSYQALRLGIDAFARADVPTAREHFLASAALDTTSATPLVWMAFTFVFPVLHAKADSTLTALESSGRKFGPWDRALLDVMKAWAAGDLAGGHTAAHRLTKVVPNSEWSFVLAWNAAVLGRAREALRVLRPIGPERGWMKGFGGYRVPLVFAYHALGDYATELAVVREALQREPDNRNIIQQEVRALAALGRVQEVFERCTVGQRLGPGAYARSECWPGIFELRAHGHEEAARRLVAHEIAALGALPDSQRADLSSEIAAFYFGIGDISEAVRVLREDPPAHPNPQFAAQLAAAQGEREAVQTYLKTLNGPVQMPWGPGIPETSILRAKLSALLGDRDEAVNWLTRALREGYRQRAWLHWDAAFYPLHGYPSFEALIRPVDDREVARQ